MMRRDTFPMSCSRQALHAPSTTSAAINTPYPMSSLALRLISIRVNLWDHLHRRVAHFVEKTIDYRPVQQDVPTRARRLSKDHVRDAFATRKIDQRIGDVSRFEFHNARAELLRKLNVLLERGVVFGLDASHLFARCLDINRVPIGREPSGDSRACAQEFLRTAARRHRHHHSFGYHCLDQPFALSILVCLRPMVLGYLSQRQL